MDVTTDKTPLLNLPYAGSTAHWATIASAKSFRLEACGPYQRRTLRTRTTILNPAGPLDISIPVHLEHQMSYRDTKLNYDTDWPRQQIYALTTAYNSTPFFEFFLPEFKELFFKRHPFLWDFNIELMHLIANLAGLELNYSTTETFAPAGQDEDDLRIAVEPKYHSVLLQRCKPVAYHQVFSEPYVDRPFAPFLSILDLIFNLGPESRCILRQMKP